MAATVTCCPIGLAIASLVHLRKVNGFRSKFSSEADYHDMKLDEEDLKCRVLSKFRKERILTSSSIVASELVLGQTGCRADLAVWNGRFVGVEVKSARDTLVRLPDQIKAYRRFFDQVMVVCDQLHLPRVAEICNKDVGIYVWREDEISVVQPASVQFEPDRYALAKALPLRLLQSCLGIKAERVSRTELEHLAINDNSIDLKSIYTAAFETNHGTTTEAFMKAISGKRISAEHLALLSRFSAARAEARQSADARQEFWAAWSAQAQTAFG